VKSVGRLSETSDPDNNIFLECEQAAKAHDLYQRREPAQFLEGNSARGISVFARNLRVQTHVKQVMTAEGALPEFARSRRARRFSYNGL
jgi:hypothetical protein